VASIDHHSGDLAMVLLGGVQYYTGQFFNIKKITEKAHRAGAIVGFDLAHAAGNVPLDLHKHKVDFAAWCSYKYLNSGPGGVAGAFIHEQHHKNLKLPRFAGWWGHNEKERFQMKKGFKPMPGADGWQLSNFPILSGSALLASLEIFEKAGMERLRKKSVLLTNYLEHLLTQLDPESKIFSIITPTNFEERGCQLSIFMKKNGKNIFETLTKKGVFADWRDPDVIRVAPVPFYNTFEEVFNFVQLLEAAIK
jgi:kynureninase